MVPGRLLTSAAVEPASALYRLLLPTFGQPTSVTRGHASPRPRSVNWRRSVGHRVNGCLKFVLNLRGRNELDVLLDEIEPGLQFRQQVEQSSAQCRQRPSQSARQLHERLAKLRLPAGVDDAQHRFGLSQVDAARQKRAQRELARLGRPRTPSADRHDDRRGQRWRADHVDLRRRLSRVAATIRPQIEIDRQLQTSARGRFDVEFADDGATGVDCQSAIAPRAVESRLPAPWRFVDRSAARSLARRPAALATATIVSSVWYTAPRLEHRAGIAAARIRIADDGNLTRRQAPSGGRAAPSSLTPRRCRWKPRRPRVAPWRTAAGPVAWPWAAAFAR